MTTIETGKWVLCWGQVQPPSNAHPDDTIVRLESHNEDYLCHVRTDHIVIPEALPDFAPKCNALLPYRQPGTFARCILHHSHGGHHRSVEDALYAESSILGYIEDV